MVAALVVTHNSQRFIEQTLVSIKNQDTPADILIAVDDSSTDGTPEMLAHHGFAVYRATSTAEDIATRIAQNFQQGLRSSRSAGAELVILGDHDDIWHHNRIQHQVACLQENPSVAMLASDGFLIDEHGAAVPGTIRSTFPVPGGFSDQPLRSQLAYALRHSIATGGASALRPTAMRDWSVPHGWLHDRWWSLAALRAHALALDTTPVIDYRLSPEQQVGLDSAEQDHGRRWLLRKLSTTGTTAARAKALARLAKR